MRSDISIGIDFGTTTSLVAEGVPGRQPVVFPIGESTTYLPSLVGLDQAGRMVTGDEAGRLARDRVRRSIKRCITRDEHEVTLGNGLALDVDAAIRGLLTTVARKAREGGLDLTNESTRLGCPAMWTGVQRQRLLGLAEEAGMGVTDQTLIDEPVAAGVAWVTHQVALRGRAVRGKLLVFDMGGGTLDVALLDIHAEPGQDPEISVLSSWGVDEAGDTLDERITDDLVEQLEGKGVDVARLPGRRDLVVQAALQAKLQLTDLTDTVVAVRAPGLTLPEITYSREELEIAFERQLAGAESLVWNVIKGARVTHEVEQAPDAIRRLDAATLAKDVDVVLLAGGMSRVPAVARLIERMLPGVEMHMHVGKGVPADEAIVTGLGETAAYDRINLHRPPFDFVLQYAAGGGPQSRTVYFAYSPFYPTWFASQRSSLYYEWRLRDGTFPRTGTGFLRIYTPGGDPIQLRVGDVEGLVEVPFGHVSPAVRIYPNGRVVVVDGKKRTSEFLVPRWPVIRGKDHATLVAVRAERVRAPVLDNSWMKDPLFLH